MNEKDMIQIKQSISMPPEMTDALIQNSAKSHRKHYRYSRYSKLCAALMSLLLIGAAGSTSLAAYNVYQEKQLAVFMDVGITQEEIGTIGNELAQIPGIASYRFISAEEAWADFKAEYLGDYANDFDENPLADSFNYEVSIWLGANTQQVREQISQLDGVRRVTTIREANELQKSVE